MANKKLHLDENGATNLVIGIIRTAADDYVKAYNDAVISCKDPYKDKKIIDIKKFFLEDNLLLDYMDANGEYIYKQLDKLAREGGKVSQLQIALSA